MKKRMILAVAILLALAIMGASLYRPLMRRYYPREYDTYTAAFSAEYAVPEPLICAVIWCESGYRPDVTSSYGACGLMQLAPATFREMLWRLDLPEDADIFDPAWNIRCGSFYLHYLYGIYENWETVLAAYNAGMGNVNNWLSDPQYSDNGITLKQIPFSETDTYVKRVLKTQQRYQTLYWEES